MTMKVMERGGTMVVNETQARNNWEARMIARFTYRGSGSKKGSRISQTGPNGTFPFMLHSRISSFAEEETHSGAEH